jgi:hypothetical protein
VVNVGKSMAIPSQQQTANQATPRRVKPNWADRQNYDRWQTEGVKASRQAEGAKLPGKNGLGIVTIGRQSFKAKRPTS